MKRDNLNTMFGVSQCVQLVFTRDFGHFLRRVDQNSGGSRLAAQAEVEEGRGSLIPEGFDFLAEKITIQED